MDEGSLLTDDEKLRISQLLDGTGEQDEPNMTYTIHPDLKKELNKIEEKLKEFQAEKQSRVETNNPQFTDFYLSQRLEEIDNSLRVLTKKKLLEKSKALELKESRAAEFKEKIVKSDDEKHVTGSAQDKELNEKADESESKKSDEKQETSADGIKHEEHTKNEKFGDPE